MGGSAVRIPVDIQNRDNTRAGFPRITPSRASRKSTIFTQ